ncbi:MAG TPA: ABC transporter substrate-binding protein [Candidatus Limnocylindrales bacterium]
MERSYSRRDILRMGVAGSAGLVVAACAGTSPTPSPSAQASASGAAPASGAASPSAGQPSASPGPLNFLTWSDHWSQPGLDRAKTQAGIVVNITELSDNSDGFVKLAQVHGQLDLVSADALWVPLYFDNGLVQAIDINSVDVASELYSMAKQFTFWTRPEGYLGYPWGWSPIQIAYNVAQVTPAPNDWQVLIDPKYKKRVVMENQPTDIMLMSARATGAKDAYNMTDAELATAKDWLTKLKPNVLKLVSQNSETVAALADGSAWLGTGNLGMPDRVKDAKGPQVDAYVPKEGSIGFIDSEMTVKGGQNQSRVIPYLNIAARADLVAQNFIDNGRPLFNEKAYQVLVNNGHKDRADRYLYNQPEQALNMTLKGPGGRVQDYIDTFNSVFGG